MFKRSFISPYRSSNTIMASYPPLIDIAVNLTDCVFNGVDWKGKQVHPSDYMNMLERAKFHGVEKCIISGTSLVQCARAIRLCRDALDGGGNSICGGTPSHKNQTTRLFCTVGVHPANSSEFLVPISDEERQYVIENGGLRGRLRGKNTESIAIEEDSADTRCNTSDFKAQPFREKEAIWKTAATTTTVAGSTTTALPTTNTSILHYTTGGPLKFGSISEEHRAYWAVNNKSLFECERLSLLEELIEANRDIVAAVGECGMDGAELEYCPYDVQARYYKMQLSLAAKLKLPLFLHSRDCGMRFVEATREFLAEPHLYCAHGSNGCTSNPSNTSTSRSCEASVEVPPSTEKRLAFSEKQSVHTFSHDFPLSGVVHSFTGDDEELTSLLEMNRTINNSDANDKHGKNARDPGGDTLSKPNVPTNFYFGLNGSAFRTEASARRSVTAIPLDRLMLETDAPWCDIRKDNFGAQFITTTFTTIKKEKMKQNVISENDPFVIIERRNEPCTMRNVLECYVGCRGLFAVEGSAGDSKVPQNAEKGLTVDGVSVSEQFANGQTDSDTVSQSQVEHIAGQVYANTIALFPLLQS